MGTYITKASHRSLMKIERARREKFEAERDQLKGENERLRADLKVARTAEAAAKAESGRSYVRAHQAQDNLGRRASEHRGQISALKAQNERLAERLAEMERNHQTAGCGTGAEVKVP